MDVQEWYKVGHNPHPFKLVRKISSTNPTAASFRSLALFPWDVNSLSTLWKGTLNTLEHLPTWKKMIAEFWDAVAVGSDHYLYVFFTDRRQPPCCVQLPPLPDHPKRLEADKMCVAWALSYTAIAEPLVIFSCGNLLYIYNICRKGISSYLRGHGGVITSISVHPSTANLFCTTSRDHTTRIYDLTRTPQTHSSNPHWPPGKHGSMAGPAHGLHMYESEGEGLGRCMFVLMGGRSGGHQAAVLASAFHPELPLIATCGMDRTVKIWVIRATSGVGIRREDKPVFSSGRIHKARVLSVTWLEHDILLTHSAPAMMRNSPDNPRDNSTYLVPGELIIWRWFGIDRFFPPDQEEASPNVLHGCSSDYQESASFKLISINAFPETPSQYQAFNVSLFHSSTHDPLIVSVLPDSQSFYITNASHLPPRKPPPFPLDVQEPTLIGYEEDELVNTAERMHLGVQPYTRDEELERIVKATSEVGNDTEAAKLPMLKGWQIDTGDGENTASKLITCAMGLGGRVIVGVGTSGSLWVWRYDE